MQILTIFLQLPHIMPQLFFSLFFMTKPKIGSFRLPIHSRDAHRNFFMISSEIGIKILARPALHGTLGSKGLRKLSIILTVFSIYLIAINNNAEEIS